MALLIYFKFVAIVASMDKASDYESGDSRFESWQGRNISSHTERDFIPNIYCHYYLPQIRGLVAQWKWHLTTNQGFQVRVLARS